MSGRPAELRILNRAKDSKGYSIYARKVRLEVEWADGKTSQLEAEGDMRFYANVNAPEEPDDIRYFGNATDLLRIPSGTGSLGFDLRLTDIDKVTEGYVQPTVAEDSLMVKPAPVGTLPDMVCSLCGTHLREEDAAWSIGPTGNSPVCGGGCEAEG